MTLNGGTLNTGGNLTFKSNGTGTARLATLGAGAVINGTATIERYIPAARGWRYLSVPITSTGAPTINQAWQEGVTTASGTPNPNPGYGGFITGGTTSNGFDQSVTNNASIKVYDNTTGTFVRLPASPGTNIPITNYPAYCVYFRGDRSINLMAGLGAAITSTTLRMKGQVRTGDQLSTVAASNFTLVSNPYPSSIDFGTLARTNVGNTLYVWDPKMAANYGLGGYVTLSWNNSSHTYDGTTSISAVSQYIQSGEAFFVASADHVSAGSITIKETDKSSSGSDLVYRYNTLDQRLRVNLFSVDSSNTASLLDAVLTTYADENSNAIDNDDAKKMWGSNQSISIKRNGQYYSIERRKTVTENDTTFLTLYQMKIQDYKLEITTENLNTGTNIAFLKDNYSNNINNTPLDLNGVNIIPFSINSDPSSYALDRFSIVFENAGPLPVTFTSVKATQDKKDIDVEWHTENEINIINYQVESSSDGIKFTSIATVIAKANNSSGAVYTWVDANTSAGIHYFRIVSTGLNNEKKYSQVAKVNIAKAGIANEMIIYPNPVKNNIVSIQLEELEKGNYIIKVFNATGQLTKTKSLQHDGGYLKYILPLASNLPRGKYQVQLSGGRFHFTTPFIKE